MAQVGKRMIRGVVTKLLFQTIMQTTDMVYTIEEDSMGICRRMIDEFIKN